MDIYINNKVLNFENNAELIEDIFISINEHLQEDSLHFSHLIIDEEEIYDNFDSYIIENIKGIKVVKVVAMPLVQLINESLISIEDYVKKAIPLINNIAEEFYQGPKENTWSMLTDLFEGIQWIIQSLTQIDSFESSNDIVSDYQIWNEYVQEVTKFNDIIFELENAILNKDNVVIGDMLLYEVMPIFEAMVEKLDVLVGTVDKDVN